GHAPYSFLPRVAVAAVRRLEPYRARRGLHGQAPAREQHLLAIDPVESGELRRRLDLGDRHPPVPRAAGSFTTCDLPRPAGTVAPAFAAVAVGGKQEGLGLHRRWGSRGRRKV